MMHNVVLTGVTIWGYYKCCVKGYPEVYGNIAEALPWIEETILCVTPGQTVIIISGTTTTTTTQSASQNESCEYYTRYFIYYNNTGKTDGPNCSKIDASRMCNYSLRNQNKKIRSMCKST